MEKYGINVNVKNKPALDDSFFPIHRFNLEFLKTAKKPVSIAVERDDGQVYTCNTFIHGTEERRQADRYYIDRLVKCMLWMRGGFRIYISGSEDIFQAIKSAYSDNGSRQFDADFMSNVYERQFEVVLCDSVPAEKNKTQSFGCHTNGCRIGFDAGGSDRKVSAVVDGTPVFSDEVVWFPKIQTDPDYHYNEIVAALKSAAGKMPRVDAVGVSSAGIYINNRTMVASLFLKVSKKDFDEKVKEIYIRAVRDTFGPEVPLVVCNDGDVSALAGAIELNDNNVLGIAMGTSEAVGYVDENGNITGWLNELAFLPVDVDANAAQDEWSGDIGCGVKYFSQDAVIKLAPKAGITLDDGLSPAEKLKCVQKLVNEGNAGAEKIFESIGTYLGHTLAFYYHLYHCKNVLLLGRVMSGKGGDIVLAEALRVLADEYPECSGKILPILPNEKSRRVGQSVAAAFIPEV